MKKLTTDIKTAIIEIFVLFYNKTISEEVFIKQLERLEKETKDGVKTIWFRFFKNDTAATTVANIKKDLTDRNRQYILDNIEIGVLEKSIVINFS